MKYIKTIIKSLNAVGQDFIVIPTIHSVDGIARERVFCYEFYHQMRKNLRIKDLAFHGELDKKRYPGFENEKPDFIIHKPGSNERNIIVIEVKTELNRHNIHNDIIKLKKFITNYRYEFGIMIIVGFSESEVMHCISDIFPNQVTDDTSDKILLLILPNSGGCLEPFKIPSS